MGSVTLRGSGRVMTVNQHTMRVDLSWLADKLTRRYKGKGQARQPIPRHVEFPLSEISEARNRPPGRWRSGKLWLRAGARSNPWKHPWFGRSAAHVVCYRKRRSGDADMLMMYVQCGQIGVQPAERRAEPEPTAGLGAPARPGHVVRRLRGDEVTAGRVRRTGF